MRLRTAFRLLFAVAILASASVAHATPAHLWSYHYGDSDDQFLSDCFADPFGNTVICGSFYGSINITTPFTSFGRRDVIVAKFAPDGTPMWSDRIGFTSVDTGWSACSDNVGNTIVAGSVGPSPNVRNAFIARYSPTGTQQWIKYFVASDSIAYTEVVDTDATKHIHVAGRFNGNINLGGQTLVATGPDNVFLAEFDAAGNHIWSKRFTTAAGTFDDLGGLRVDPSGQPVLYGGFNGTVNFGGTNLTTVAASDLFLAKFTESGGHLWSKRFATSGFHMSGALDVDPLGRIAITGETWGTLDFGGGPLNAPGAPDIFLAVLNASGGHVWSKVFGAGDQESGLDVAFASNNDVLLTAYGQGTDPFTFGGAPMSGQANFNDLYVARFLGSNGAHRWSTRYFGVGGGTYGYVDEADGQLMLAGTITAATDFGGGGLLNQGGEDIYVARFADQLTGAAPALARASLAQNSPNPFNPSTVIAYTLSAPARVVIEIADASGAMVARLDEGGRPAGSYSATWNGRDSRGRAVASGVYFYRLAGMPDVPARKMLLLK